LTKTIGVPADVLQQWTDRFGFPKATASVFRGTVFVSREFVYSRAAIAAWQQEILGIAARLK
jgi:hypothetical protein